MGSGVRERSIMKIDDIKKEADEKSKMRRYSIHDGFIFRALTEPATVYDAILIKNPEDAPCSCPVLPSSQRTLQEHIDLINKYHLEKAKIIAKDIEFITECPSLKYISITPSDDAGNNFDYSPLYRMPQIKSLFCATVYGKHFELTASVDYSKIKGLEDVSISGAGHKNYNTIESLKDLGISQYKDTDLAKMFCSSVLDSLMIIQCRIKTLNGIQKSKNMQCLSLYYNRSLSDISALSEVKDTLTSLRIENCPKIEDFSVLAELENLEFLDLRGSNSLPSLDFLKSMRNLKTFVFDVNVLDGDLSLCKDLSFVRSLKNRKHYNLRDDDLPKGEFVYGNEGIDPWRRRKN